MLSQSHSPLIARCLLYATLLTLGLLAIVSPPLASAARLPQEDIAPPEDEVDPQASILEKRLLGMGGVLGILPSLLGTLVPEDVVSSIEAQVTAEINSLLPLINESNAQSSNGVALTTSGQSTPPLTAEPIPTGAQLGALADKLGDLLNDVLPVAAPSIIAAITKKAHGVVSSIEAIATEVASLGNDIGSGQIQAPDALSRIGDLFSSLDSKVDDIVKDVTSDLTSKLPLPILHDLGQVVSSGLGDIVGAANGPVSLVGDIIEHNACGVVTTIDGILATVAGLCGDMSLAVAQVSSEIATASLTNADVTLTDFPSSSLVLTSIPNITAGPTSSTSPLPTSTPSSTSSTESAHTGESANFQTTTTGANGVVTVTEYEILSQQCRSNIEHFASLVEKTVTLTIHAACPKSVCPLASQPTCHCPNAPTPPGGYGDQGPCPGSGYTCDDCVDGWFCPPSHTPAQPAPCGFGWPCAHCEGGWFCAPKVTPGTCAGSSAPTASHPITSAATSCSSSRPTSSRPAASEPSPPPPEKVKGWKYCGCFSDDKSQRALDEETFTLDLLTNEACIQHCLIRGYLMAGTENGSQCFCGNFLNGTQLMGDDACSMPCSGDATQKCGGLNALSCYNPDGEPYGWASAGPQLRTPTMQPPEVLELNIGGVAHTKITTPALIFPPGNADPAKITSEYGKTISRPLGDFPADMTFSTPLNSPSSSSTPNGAGGVAPGQGTLSSSSGSGSSPNVSGPSGSSTGPNGGSVTSHAPATPATPGTSPSSPNSSGPSGSPSSPSSPTSPSASGSQGAPSTSGISGSSESAASPGSSSPPGSPSSPSSSESPNNHGSPSSPGTSGSPSNHDTSITASVTSHPSVPGTSNASTNPNGSAGVAPVQGSPPTSSSNGEHSLPSSTDAITTSPNTNPTSGVSSSPVAASSKSPNGSSPGPSGTSSSTPDGAGGVAPVHGTGSSTTSGSQNPSFASSGGSTGPSSTIPTGGVSETTAPTEPAGSGQGPGHPSSNMASGSKSCTPGVNGDCITTGEATNPVQSHGSTSPAEEGTAAPTGPSNTGGGSNTEPGQTHGPTSPSQGGSPSGSTPTSNSVSPTNNPSSSSPISGGAVAPGHGQPSTSPSPRSGSTPCPSGSCNSLDSGSTTPSQSRQPTGATPSTNPSTCPPGSNDPACTSPFGGSGVAPEHGQPSTSNPSSIPSTCAPDSTDPHCTSPMGGSAVAPEHSQPTSSMSSSNPASQTNQPSGPSSPSNCTPGSTDPNCANSSGSGSLGPQETPTSNLSPGSSPRISTVSTGSEPSNNGGSTAPNGQGPVTSPNANESGSLSDTGSASSGPSGTPSTNQATQSASSPSLTSPLSHGSTSTPNGAGGVAPGQRSSGTQLTLSSNPIGSSPTTSDNGDTSGTTRPSDVSGSSAAVTETGPNPSSPNGGLSSTNAPEQSTPSNPNQSGSVGPSATSSGPHTSFVFAPGPVPYGGASPSMTTMTSLLAWREPDGEKGVPAMLHPDHMDDEPSQQQDAPTLEFEEAPTTTTTFSNSPYPRWQRIRPVYVW